MARYTKVLKSLAHNAVGDRRIQAAAPAGNNFYVTGATLNNSNDVLTLAVKGAASVTVDLSHLAAQASPGGSDTQIQFNDGGAFGGSANLTWDDSDLAIGNSGKLKVVNASSNYWAMYNQSNGKMRIDQGTTQRVLASSGEFQFANDIIVDNDLLVGSSATVNGARLHVQGAENLLANFFSTDGIGEIRIGDNYPSGHKYTRILNVGHQLKLMPNNGAEMMNLDGSAYKTTLLGETGGNSPKLMFDNPDASNDIQLTQGDAGWFGLSTDGGSTQHFIARTGNIGIGTESPVRKLEVNSSTIDIVAKFASSDNRATIDLTDDDTSRYITTENSAISLGPNSSLHSNNLNIVGSPAKLGIGTTSPSYPLHINGAATQEVRVQSSDSGAYSRIQLRSATDGFAQFNMGDSGADAAGGLVYTHSTDTLNIRAANSNIMNVTSAGVSIAGNLMFPDSNNTISAFGSDNLYLRAHNDMYFNIDTPNDSTTRHFIFRANTSSEIMRLGEDLIAEFKGNVGIGTAAPSAKLEVTSPTNSYEQARFQWDASNYLGVFVDSAGNSQLEAKTGNLTLKTDTSAHDVRVDSKGNFRVDLGDSNGGYYTRIRAANSNPVLMAKSNGLIGIGTESPAFTLDVVGTTQLSGAATINGTTTIDGGQLKVTDGGASSPLVSIAADDANPWAFHIGNDTYSTAKASGTQMYQGNTGIMNIYHKDIKRMQFQVNGDSSLGTATNVGLYVQSGGNVGIATNAPGETLHVAGTGRFTGKVAFGSSTLPTTTGISVSNTIQVAEKSSAPTHVESNGILWVKDDNPTNLYFTDDDGNDIALTNNGSAAGGGTFGGSISSGKLAIGTGTDTIGNFVDALTENDSIYIGANPASTTNTAQNNTALGISALNDITTGDNNVAIGIQAGQKTTTQERNTIMGVSALRYASGSASYNVALGFAAMGASDQESQATVAVGYYALSGATGANSTVAVGHLAGRDTTTGDNNVYIGKSAAYLNTTQGNNVAVGGESMGVAGSHASTALGYFAMNAASSQNSVAVGAYALRTGSNHYNVAVGMSAMTKVSGAAGGVAVGYQSGYHPTGNYNVFMGYNAGFGTAAGGAYNNVGVGREALMVVSSGYENTAVGYQAMKDSTTGFLNVAIGAYAATGNTTGQENTAVGHSALQENQEGDHIVAIGRYAAYNTNPTAGTGDSVVVGTEAGFTNTTGVQNTFIGHRAGYNNTTSNQQVFVGREAGYNHTEGTTNIFIGARSGYLNTTGANNTVVGHQALYNNVHGDRNTAIGYQALHSSTPSDGGGQNTAVGDRAGYTTSTGHSNVYMGYLAGYSLTDGERNVIIGHEAARYANNMDFSVIIGNNAGTLLSGAQEAIIIGRNTGYYVSGNRNTFVGTNAGFGRSDGTHATTEAVAIGRNAMYYNSTTNYCVAIGSDALLGASSSPYMTGDNNVAVGRQAARNTSSGYSNTSVGYQTSYSMTTGAGNTHMGNQAGYSGSTHNNTTFIGNSAGLKNTSNDNVAIGAEAYLSGSSATQIVAIGRNAGKGITTGQGVIAIGPNAAQENEDGTHNVAIGWQALMGASGKADKNIGIGTSALLDITNGTSNVGVGYQALQNITTGDYNIAMGDNALRLINTQTSNVGIGHSAGYDNNQSDNVFVGSLAGFSSESSGSTLVGFQAGYYPHGNHNVFVGYKAGKGDSSGIHTASENVAVGREAFTAATSASANVMLGYFAGYSQTTGDDNVYIGTSAGKASTTAAGNVAIGKDAMKIGAQTSSNGGQNSVVGYAAYVDGTGQRNAILGYRAAYTSTSANSNVAIGYEAGQKNTTGDSNVFIGNKAGPSSTSTASNELYIHNDESSTPLIKGDFSTPAITVNGTLSVTGSSLAVQKLMKNDVSGDYTISTDYSHYRVMAYTGDAPTNITVTITAPANPRVGDEYTIVTECGDSPAANPSFANQYTATVRIIANTGQTINTVNTNININSIQSATLKYNMAKLICIDNNAFALIVSDIGPVA